MEIILGSKSPRRKELLEKLGYKFKIVPSDVDENIEEEDPIKKVLKIAKMKAIPILSQFPSKLIITADTIVLNNNIVLGKPKDKEEAYKMIRDLQNNSHYVYTAVVCINKDINVEFVEATKVYVVAMTDEEINEYINSQEPYDKAGGYGIQGMFAKFIEKIEGDYYNVMGLPICKLNKTIKEIKKTL